MPAQPSQPKIIALASGKGGVGKTNLAVNLGVALSETGRRVLLFDADLGLANLDVLLGLTPHYNIRHVLERQRRMEEVLVKGPAGISILPASSGVSELAELPRNHADRLIEELTAVAANYDYLIIDTPSGIGANVLRFSWMADELLVVTTPEPTSITDAYALVKLVRREKADAALRLVVNMADDSEEASRVAEAFSEITSRFLGMPTDCAGGLTLDENVPLAVRRQQPFVTCYPNCQASRSVRKLTRQVAAPCESATVAAAADYCFPNRIRRWLDTH